MKRLALICVAAALAVACQDSTIPTRPMDLGMGGQPPGNAALQAQINAVINELFDQPEKQQAHQLMASVKNYLAVGDTSEAASLAAELINLGVAKVTQDDSKIDLLNQLSGLLGTFVGEEELEVLAAKLEEVLDQIDPTDRDVGIGVIGTKGGLVTTNPEKGPNRGFAGSRIPEGALETTRVVLIERIRIGSGGGSSAPASASAATLDQEQCLPIGLPQFEGCYRFTTDPPIEEEFSDSVEVGVCAEPVGLDPAQVARLRLHALDDNTVTALPLVEVDFLDCTDFTVSGDEPQGLVGFARAGLRALQQELSAAFSPEPLLANNTALGPTSVGLGGKKGGYSDIGVALTAKIEKFAGDLQTGTVGTPLPIDPEVRVTDEEGDPVANAEVNFSVVGGGGSVSDATVLTGLDGKASVTWTLGTTPGTNTLEVWSEGMSSELVTEGVLTTETLVFTATGVPGPPAVLDFTVEPSDAIVGAVITPAVEVTLLDAFGNVSTAATNEIALTLTGPGSLSGTSVRNAVAGIATFDDLSVDAPGTYTLQANSGLLVPIPSLGFTISAPPSCTICIDGVLSPGEWDEPEYSFGPVTVNLPGEAGTTTAMVYVETDATDLFVAVEFAQDLSWLKTHTVGVRLDENPMNGTWDLGGDGNGDDGFVVQYKDVNGIRVDRVLDSHYSCGPFEPPAPCQGQNDTAWNGTNDGTTAIVVNGLTTVIEASHPLNSGDFRDAVLGDVQEEFYGLLVTTYMKDSEDRSTSNDLVPAWSQLKVGGPVN